MRPSFGASGDGIYVRCTTGQTFNVQVTSSNAAPATIYTDNVVVDLSF